MYRLFFIFAVVYCLPDALDKKTICTAGGEFGPNTGSMCPLGAQTVLNGMCCDVTKIQYVPCEDQLDAQGNSLCPLTRLGCYRDLLGSLKEEADLCAKTCGFCPLPFSLW